MTWQTERPTTGKWWVAIHSSKRHLSRATEWPQECEFSGKTLRLSGLTYSLGSPLVEEFLAGALWLQRETPADPFASEAEPDKLAAALKSAAAWEIQAQDFRDKLAAAERRLAQFEWQPIETAPKDGTLILAWIPGVGSRVVLWRIGRWYLARSSSFYGPTHWMRLPLPPKVTT